MNNLIEKAKKNKKATFLILFAIVLFLVFSTVSFINTQARNAEEEQQAAIEALSDEESEDGTEESQSTDFSETGEEQQTNDSAYDNYSDQIKNNLKSMGSYVWMNKSKNATLNLKDGVFIEKGNGKKAAHKFEIVQDASLGGSDVSETHVYFVKLDNDETGYFIHQKTTETDTIETTKTVQTKKKVTVKTGKKTKTEIKTVPEKKKVSKEISKTTETIKGSFFEIAEEYTKTDDSTIHLNIQKIEDAKIKELEVSQENIDKYINQVVTTLSPTATEAKWDNYVTKDYTQNKIFTSYTLNDNDETCIGIGIDMKTKEIAEPQ